MKIQPSLSLCIAPLLLLCPVASATFLVAGAAPAVAIAAVAVLASLGLLIVHWRQARPLAAPRRAPDPGLLGQELRGILGLADQLLEGELNDDQRELAQALRGAVEVALLEEDKLELDCAPFDLEDLCWDVCDVLAPRAADNGAELCLRFAADAPRHLIGDAGRIRQMLLHMLRNTIRVTRGGHVLLWVECEAEDSEGVRLRLAVEGTGAGLGAERLMLCQKLAGLMGGSAGLRGELGQGSTAWVSLPLPRSPVPPSAPQPALLLRARVLLADEHPLSMQLLCEQLQRRGLQPVLARSPAELRAALDRAVADAASFQVAIVDEGLLSGDQEGRLLQHRGLRRGAAVLLSPSAERREELRDAGYGVVLRKPVRPRRLMTVCHQILTERPPTSGAQAPPPAPPRPRRPRPAPDLVGARG